MKARYLPIASVLFAGGASTAACGSHNGQTGSPSVLATVQGNLSLTADAPALADNVHIAVIWQTGPQNQFKVAVDLPVKPVFPSKYVLALTEPPPQSARQHPAADHPEFSMATGALVAYEDLNGNGQLDLVFDDAGSFPDRVLATNPKEELLYLDSSTGHLPSELQNGAQTPSLGYNLFTGGECTATVHANLPDGGLSAPDMTSCLPAVFLPMSAPYDLPFSNNPDLNLLACQGRGAGPTSPLSAAGISYWEVNDAGTPPGGYPAPGAQHLMCLAGRVSYQYQTCQTMGGLCSGTTVCDQLQQVDLGGAPKPSGWPCP